MFNTMEVGNRIREARNRMNKTQMALADEMGVSYQAVSNWERGNSMPDIGKLPDLCKVLNVSVSDLLGEEKETETVLRLVEHQTVEPERLAGIAPMVDPEELARSVREVIPKAADSMESLLPLLPYMEDEDLEALARQAAEKSPDHLRNIAAFLSTNALNRLAEETEDIRTLEAIALFLPEETLDRCVEKLMAQNGFSIEQIEGLLIFLGKGTVKKLVAYTQGRTAVKD